MQGLTRFSIMGNQGMARGSDAVDGKPLDGKGIKA